MCFSLSFFLLSHFINSNPTLGSVVFNMESYVFKKDKIRVSQQDIGGFGLVPPGRIKRAFVVKCAQLFENLVSNSLLNLEMTPGELLKTQLQPNPKCGVELIDRFQRPPPSPPLCQ